MKENKIEKQKKKKIIVNCSIKMNGTRRCVRVQEQLKSI